MGSLLLGSIATQVLEHARFDPIASMGHVNLLDVVEDEASDIAHFSIQKVDELAPLVIRVLHCGIVIFFLVFVFVAVLLC